MSLKVTVWQQLQWLVVTHDQQKVFQLLMHFLILMLQYFLLTLLLLSLGYLLCKSLLLQHLLDHTRNLMNQLGVVLACTC